MISVEIINTGTELTLGRVVNTHLAFLAQSLFGLGLRVARQVTVPDGEEIRDAFQVAFKRSHLIILTGGLGPTSDDITRDIVSEAMQRPLHFDEAIWAGLEVYFSNRGKALTDMQKRQAMVPEAGIVLPNPSGTAPGLIIPFGESGDIPGAVVLLPGPPHELRDVWDTAALPWLQSYFQNFRAPVNDVQLRLIGVGETDVELKLEKAARELGVTEVGYCARPGEVDLRFIGPKKAVDAAAALARVEFKDHIYAEGLDMMEHVVVHLARARKLKLATVESCTGGFIANRISNVPFGSEVLGYGWVTASNEAKMTELGVPPELIETHGPVSEQVTRALAEGALKRSDSDLALAVTGVPGSFVNRDLADTMENAPGSIHLALAQKGVPTQYIQKRVFRDREVFKYMASQIGLNMMREALLGSGIASS